MGDSVQILHSGYNTRIPGSRPPGRLHKGHNITAATSSIPSKYQTVVIDNSDRKGFNSKSRRFDYESVGTENPGPGNYVGHSNIEKNSSSFSKKGTGGFASKDRRLFRPDVPAGPGAGVYGLPSLLRTTKDFNKGGCTSTFHQPLAKNVEEKSCKLPAPNSYDVSQGVSKMGKTNNVTADAAFKSRSKREAINVAGAKNTPAPWQYNVKEELVRAGDRAPVAIFKSQTKRQMAPSPPLVPGPGAYKPFEELDAIPKTVFPRKHYLCISAPAMPLPKTPPQPGPGTYELVDFHGEPKHYMSGAAFVSTTSRWATGGPMVNNENIPGPAHYRPGELNKQSFIYNANNRWI